MYYRNVGQLYTLGESIEGLGMYIALSGLQHAGVSILKNLEASIYNH